MTAPTTPTVSVGSNSTVIAAEGGQDSKQNNKQSVDEEKEDEKASEAKTASKVEPANSSSIVVNPQPAMPPPHGRPRHNSAAAAVSAAVNAAANAAVASPGCGGRARGGRSVSTFSAASYTYHNTSHGGGEYDDGSDCIAARPSRSQPCSHHPSFSNPSSSR